MTKRGDVPRPELLAFATALRLLQGSRWKGLLAKLRIYFFVDAHTRNSVKYRELQGLSLLTRSRFHNLLKDLVGSGRLERSSEAYYNITPEGRSEYDALVSSLLPMMNYVCEKYHLEKTGRLDLELMIPELSIVIQYVKDTCKPRYKNLEEALANIEDYLAAPKGGFL